MHFAPLVARKFAGSTLPAYDLSSETTESRRPADLVLIDGPPRALGGREAVLYQAMAIARPGTLVLLDDADRAEERRALSAWQRHLGDAIRIEHLDGFPKGLAAVLVVDPVRPGDLEGHATQTAARRLQQLIDADAAWIVVDDGTLGEALSGDARVLAFVDQDGLPPDSDDGAITALERLRQGGATHLAFVEDSRWWLDRYPGFATFVDDHFERVVRDDHLILYDLHASA